MLVVYGERLFGRIQRVGSTCIATRWFHVWYMPLWPAGSHVVLAEGTDGTYEAIPIARDPRSIAAALLRSWGVVGVFLLATRLSGPLAAARGTRDVAGPLGLAAVLAAGLVWAWFGFGRLTHDAYARHLVYNRCIGLAVDPSALPERHRALRHQLGAAVESRAAALGLAAHPGEATSAADGLDPAVDDALYLANALTLARVEQSAASDTDARARWGAKHAALWARFRALDANVMAHALDVRRAEPAAPWSAYVGLVLGLAVIVYAVYRALRA